MKKLILLLLIMFITTINAQSNQYKADSTQYENLIKQKQKLIEFIVQKQSDIYEAQEQLKDAYNKLSQLNIAIQLYDEKLKMYKKE